MSRAADLYSHFEPTLRLKNHIGQVWAAARFLLASHSSQARERRPETPDVLQALVRSHDLGKGSPAFQQYIRDPAGYRDDPRKKEHSALSAALAILWAREQCWPALRTLALAQAVAGHHAGFATLDHLWNARLRLDDDDVLQPQWEGLDRAALADATGLDLRDLQGGFEDGGRWLFRRQKVGEQLSALPLAEAVRFRLWTQFVFSMLLEADKAFLALREEKLLLYLHSERRELSSALVDSLLARVQRTPLNPLRQRIRTQLLKNLEDGHPCSTLTLPTGVGKTLLAASWALTLRNRMTQAVGGIAPKIIVVLPYLSIIDQTEQEYRRLFGLSADSAAQSETLMASHSLSQREYELESKTLGRAYTEFFIDTWRSEVILTTFDQLLLALFSNKTRHLMRFHQLMDALIILDEVQTLPCGLWDLADHALRALTEEGNSRVLMMSATQPALLRGARELAGDEQQVAAIFARFKRYRIRFRLRDQDLEEFIGELLPRLDEWIAAKQRVLITLNTRSSARVVWHAVAGHLDDRVPVFLISADVTPRDRLAKIAAIKEGTPCVVASTQTVEAGVDIDMDVTLRDFAPLDALVQVAGRCNRNNRLGDHGGEVEVVSLVNEKSRQYARMVYDSVLLGATHQVLDGVEYIGEEAVLDLSRRYFALLKERMNTGEAMTEAFARWQETPDIRSLLRGENRNQVSFLVLEDQDSVGLREEIETACAAMDRWDRRTALRRLAAAIQQRSVSIYARPDLHPEDFADPLGPFWILHEGWYSADSGLDLQLERDDPACII